MASDGVYRVDEAAAAFYLPDPVLIRRYPSQVRIVMQPTPPALSPYQQLGAFQQAQRNNHRLRLRSGVFSPLHLAVLERALAVAHDRLKRDCQLANPRLPRCLLTGGLALRLMIDLGRDLAEIAGYNHSWVVPNCTRPPNHWGLVSWVNGQAVGRCWVLRPGVGSHPRAGHVRVIQRTCLLRTERWLDLVGLLPHPAMAPPLSLALPVGPAVPMFSASVRQLELDVDGFLNWARQILGPRGHLLSNLPPPATIVHEDISWAENGDRALADTMTGVDSDDAALDYTHPPDDVLEAQDERLAAAAGGSQSNATGAPKINASRASASKAVGLRQFRDAFAAVDWKIDRRRDIVTEHERLTVLIWLVLSVALASRARIQPLPGPQLIDPRARAFFVQDKATRKGKPPWAPETAALPANALGDARIIFVPHGLRRQIESYSRHLRLLAKRADIDPEASMRIAELTDRLEKGKLIWFFELKRTWHGSAKRLTVQPLRPTRIALLTQTVLGLRLEANFARHMLRSGLVGRVSSEVIDALLGHWEQGREPWSTGSALDPMAVRAMMATIQRATVPMPPAP